MSDRDIVDYRDCSIKKESEIEPDLLYIHHRKDIFDSSVMGSTMIDYHDAGLTERVRIASDFVKAYVGIMFEGF